MRQGYEGRQGRTGRGNIGEKEREREVKKSEGKSENPTAKYRKKYTSEHDTQRQAYGGLGRVGQVLEEKGRKLIITQCAIIFTMTLTRRRTLKLSPSGAHITFQRDEQGRIWLDLRYPTQRYSTLPDTSDADLTSRVGQVVHYSGLE